MGRYVLITRPEAEAQSLAESVRAYGFTPLVEPMMTIVPLEVTLPDLKQYQALVFTSANGVRAFADLSAERGHKVYCVGDISAAEARACGWHDVTAADGFAVDLIALLEKDVAAGSRLLHLSGQHIAREIAPAGLSVDRLAVYHADAATDLSPDLLGLLDEGELCAALFFSARTASIFTELLESAGCTQAVKTTKALCLADSVVKSLQHIEWQDVQVSARPDRGGMMDLLKALP